LEPRKANEVRQDGTIAFSTGYRAVFAEAQRRGWTNPRRRAANAHPLPGDTASDAVGEASDRPLLVDVRELLDHPVDPRWLVDGIIETPGVGAVVGATACGKSFITIDLACCVAAGRPWVDRATEKGGVVYIAGEGKNGLVRRVHAWQKTHGIVIPKSTLFLNGHSFELTPDGRRALVQAAVREGVRPTLIVLDTLARTFPIGEDENSLS
jgi:AAA domain